MFYYNYLNNFYNKEDINTFQKFCEFNERKLIENTDLTTYSTFDDVMKAVSIAEMKVDMKEEQSLMECLVQKALYRHHQPEAFAAVSRRHRQRHRAVRSELARRRHEAATEVMLPDTVHDDARGEWILRAGHPVG